MVVLQLMDVVVIHHPIYVSKPQSKHSLTQSTNEGWGRFNPVLDIIVLERMLLRHLKSGTNSKGLLMLKTRDGGEVGGEEFRVPLFSHSW